MAAKVFIVNNVGNATHKVFFVDNPGHEKNKHIIAGGKLVDNVGNADVKVFIVDNVGHADICIMRQNFPRK
jgi:hypothetical protein